MMLPAIRVEQGLTTPDQDYVNLAEFFRWLFKAEWSTWRKVYWLDHRTIGRERTVLRQVTQAGRRARQTDKVISILPGKPDLDWARLSVATSTAQQLLTDVRWEIYADGDCQQRLDMGRFDHIDLVGKGSIQHVRQLVESGQASLHQSLEAWDYDGLIMTHLCPSCYQIYGQQPFAFFPEWICCQHCDWRGSSLRRKKNLSGEQTSYLRKQVLGIVNRLLVEDMTLLPVELAPDMPIEKQFLESVVTPVFCWMVTDMTVSGTVMAFPLDKKSHTKKSNYGSLTFYQLVKHCFERTLFAKLRDESFREAYREFVSSYYEQRIHELESGIRTPAFLATVENPRASLEWVINDWRRSKEQVNDEVTLLGNLENIMFEADPQQVAEDQTFRQLAVEAKEAVQQLPLVMEDLLELLAEKHQGVRE